MGAKYFMMIAAFVITVANPGVVWGEDIDLDLSSLAEWEPLEFPKIPEHSTFEAVIEDGREVIRVESVASASAIVYSKTFNLKDTPVIKWSWKVLNILEKGNAEKKSGDDYPIRLYVMFPYEPSRVPALQRIGFEIAKRRFGEYPPAEVLNYIWANREHDREPLESPYTDRTMLFFPNAGSEGLGEWQTHTANILEDYRRAFDREPPDTFTLAVMGDSDNTGERTLAYIGEITLSSR